MNLNPFFYAQTEHDIMYYMHNSTESAHKFYLNEELVGEHKKTLGNYSVTRGNIEFILESKLTKLDIKFKVDGNELKSEKVTKKQMRELLTYRNIYNEINPTKKEIENARFKLTDLLLPLILIVIAVGIQYFTHDKSLIYKIIPGIPCFIAGIILRGILVKHVKFLDPLKKLGIAFVILVFILVEFLSNQLYG